MNLFGEDTRKQASYFVFHDESEPEPNKGWLLIGLLFVNANATHDIEKTLAAHRNSENYGGEIHFSKLPKSFGGKFGAKARVARHWMRAYQGKLCEQALFTCLAVNRSNPKFEYRRFAEHYHAYNRFTAMAIKAGISFLLAPLGYDEIELTVVSDRKDRKSRPDVGLADNFESYLAYRVELDSWFARSKSGSNKYPAVKMQPVRSEDSAQSDLLQLTDLLLGCIQSALSSKAKSPVKQELREMVKGWYRDLKCPPKDQKYKMRQKFNIWGFPNDEGGPFSDFPELRSPSERQLALPFN